MNHLSPWIGRIALLGAAMLACTPLMTWKMPRAEAASRPWLELDEQHLSAKTRDLVVSSVRVLDRMELDLPAKDPRAEAFQDLFGGARGSNVVTYLSERIRYVGADLDSSDSREANNTYASNYSVSWISYFYRSHYLGERHAKPEMPVFRGSPLPIVSPRTGLVALGKLYRDPSTTALDRIETLVHEARHSDCPAPPSRADAAKYDRNRISQMSDAGLGCTQVHVPCPKGHGLAGDLACDRHEWGAYSVGYVFAESVFRFCVNCSEAQRQEALATAKEDFTRLTPELRKGISQGALGRPRMESIE